VKQLMSFLVIAAVVLAFLQRAGAEGQSNDIHAANKRLGRGINLGNALEAPKEGAWGVTLKTEYFRTIKEAGFATVRLPVNWAAHAGAVEPYLIDANFAQRVDWAIDQALANKLNIILDLHHYGEMHANPDKHLPRLLALWRQIAERYAKQPPEVYFELYNEPQDKLNEAKWNAAIPQLLAVVRKSNPTRPIIVGPALWNGIRALDKLELPENDRNLILTVHFYDPFQFTHQGAGFVKGADQWKGKTWGTEADKTAVRSSFAKAAAWAKKHGRPVFLGEFGVYQEAPMDSRAKWIHCAVHEAEQNGFSWAYWEFCSGFGAYDPKTDQWRGPLKEALIQ
jgi:endoglucanase